MLLHFCMYLLSHLLILLPEILGLKHYFHPEYLLWIYVSDPCSYEFCWTWSPREVRIEAACFLQQLCQSRWRVSPFIIPLLWFAKQRIRTKTVGFLVQLVDIANVHCLPWNTYPGGFSRGWSCQVQFCNLFSGMCCLQGQVFFFL